MEPVISCLYIRPSTAIEELNASANAEVSASDRPAQSLFMVRSPCMIFAKPPLAMPRMVRGGGFLQLPLLPQRLHLGRQAPDVDEALGLGLVEIALAECDEIL